ncbi:hypothetical protein [Streptomyces huasconensis]|uniref:hypothetical protein n=1 Tax=Streptomyces huasconensis TaxID=1854574 RepID=UPI0033C60E1F
MRRLRRHRQGDPLGFGIGEVTAVLGPLLMLTVEASISTVVGSATGSVFTRLTTWLRRVFGREPVTLRLPELSRDQLRALHDLLVEQLVQSQVPDETARAVAERISGRLALGGSEARDRLDEPEATDESGEPDSREEDADRAVGAADPRDEQVSDR